MVKTGLVIALSLFLVLTGGCATHQALEEGVKSLCGLSTKVLEDTRDKAVTKTFDCDYSTLNARVENALAAMDGVSVYAREPEKRMIAVYYSDVNTTPVGIFFNETDASHTELEVSSPSLSARTDVSKALFSKLTPTAKQE